jgi:membrane protease YdiL (CAAX protease family)
MKKIFGVNLYFLILVLLQIFGGYLLKPFVYLFNGKMWLILLATQILFLIVPLVIYLIVTKKSVVSTLRLKKIRLKNLPSIIGVALLIYPIAAFLGFVTDLFFHNNVGDVLSKMNSLPLWAFVLIIALTPAICEEMTMRGIVLSGYNKMGINGAAVITGFLFAVLHMNPPQFLYTFALGVIFAYLVRITNSIFSSMICHFAFNGISACATWFQLKHGVKNTDITSLSPMVRNSMFVTLFVFTVGAVVGIVFIILYLKKINPENEIMNVSVTQGDIVIENDKTVYKIIAYVPIVISVILYIAYVLYVGKIIS